MFENAKDINSGFNGIHNGSKTFERIKDELDDYAITFSRIFMKIEDVCQQLQQVVSELMKLYL